MGHRREAVTAEWNVVTGVETGPSTQPILDFDVGDVASKPFEGVDSFQPAGA